MSYKVLALKHRPQDFAAVVGQQAVLLALQYALDNDQVHHAYLFTGTRGVGKTTLARILAKCLNCERGVSSKPCNTCDMCVSITRGDNLDVIEIDAASRTKVEDTRDLLHNVPYSPVRARFKIYIIDEVHMLSNHSFNALLKTLEEPPEYVKFILATTDPQKLPITVLSRCLQFHLRHLTVDQITLHLIDILQQEQINFEPNALPIVAQCANGSIRDALSLLEQVIAFSERNVSVYAAQQVLGTSVHTQALNLLSLIISNDARKAIESVRELAATNADFNQVLRILQTLIYQVALVQIVPDVIGSTVADSEKIMCLAKLASAVDLQLYYQATLLGVRDLPFSPDIVIGFEMIVLRMLAFQPVAVNELAVTQPMAIQTSTSFEPPLVADTLPVMDNNRLLSKVAVASTASTTQFTATVGVGEKPIDTNWADIITKLNLTGLTKVIAENCIVSDWQEELITLNLQDSQKPLLNSKHIERIQTALQEYLHKNIKLNISVGVSNSALHQETPAVQMQRFQQATAAAAEQAIKMDTHVQQLEQVFSAKIADINVNEK